MTNQSNKNILLCALIIPIILLCIKAYKKLCNTCKKKIIKKCIQNHPHYQNWERKEDYTENDYCSENNYYSKNDSCSKNDYCSENDSCSKNDYSSENDSYSEKNKYKHRIQNLYINKEGKYQKIREQINQKMQNKYKEDLLKKDKTLRNIDIKIKNRKHVLKYLGLIHNC